MTSITIVTPWHQSHELAAAYWRAINAGVGELDRVLVIDNASEPMLFTSAWDTAPAAAWDIRLYENIGFSRACNVGLKFAGKAAMATDAVLFLNNDVRLVAGDWLERIRAALAPGVLVGAKLRDGAHTAVDGIQVPYLDGWCLAGMRADLDTLGGWNETFEEPAYYGDNELCARARAAGMQLVEANVGLRHLENYTSRRMPISEISARNRARYETIVREQRAA